MALEKQRAEDEAAARDARRRTLNLPFVFEVEVGDDGRYHRAESSQDFDCDFDSGDESAFNVIVGKHRPPEYMPDTL